MKNLRRFGLFLLTCGASLIIGLLSFGGLLAVWPILPLALVTFILAVAYEGEIYFQNIKGAFRKLFQLDYLKREIAKTYMLTHFPKASTVGMESDRTLSISMKSESSLHTEVYVREEVPKLQEQGSTPILSSETRGDVIQLPEIRDNRPLFFKDYEIMLYQLDVLKHSDGGQGHVHLDRESRQRKKRIEKTLNDMEKWFSIQWFGPVQERRATQPLSFHSERNLTPYALDLQNWFNQHQAAERDLSRSQLAKYRWYFHGTKVFSIVAGVFMGIGTTYLLSDTFAAVSFLSILPAAVGPAIIIPMAAVAGLAYSLLIYNAVTDMVKNDTIIKWYKAIRDDWKGTLSVKAIVRNVFMTFMALALTGLAITLTVCTAGTWWTVIKQTPPLFAWMGQIPRVFMGIINPIVLGLSSIVFNLQNTSETLELVNEGVNHASTTKGSTSTPMTRFRIMLNDFTNRENRLQQLNPFRFLLKITIAPLQFVLFLGHLVSMSLSGDRVPGIPIIASALLGIISEGFEDAHYFIGHEHERKKPLEERLGAGPGHHHHNNLPSRLIKLIALPVYLFATLWDYVASQSNRGERKPLTLNEAWKKQIGAPEEISVGSSKNENPQDLSMSWRLEQVVDRIERYKIKHLDTVIIGCDLAKRQREALTGLQETLRTLETVDDNMKVSLQQAKGQSIYAEHYFFGKGPTRTQVFLENEVNRITASLPPP